MADMDNDKERPPLRPMPSNSQMMEIIKLRLKGIPRTTREDRACRAMYMDELTRLSKLPPDEQYKM